MQAKPSQITSWSNCRLSLSILILFAITASAQVDTQLPEWLTADERARIEKEHGDKDRVEVLLKVSAARLAAARTNIANQQYEQAGSEIKNYGALISYTLAFIAGSPKKEKDKKNIYRVIELNLRRDLSLLESARYELPQKYSDEANEVYEQVKKARETALGAIFGKDFFPTK